METTKDSSVNNGVNVEALFSAQEALANAPEAAKFKWRSTRSLSPSSLWQIEVRNLNGCPHFYSSAVHARQSAAPCDPSALDADHVVLKAAGCEPGALG